MTQKPKIAILSIRNSYQYGGVLATLKVAYDFCEQYFDPTVFVLSFDKTISAHLRPPKFSSATRESTYCGMKCIEIGSRWAFWEPGHYAFSIKQWEQALAGYDYFFAVSATPIAAHPLALLNKKFILWASTTYHDDRTERVKKLRGVRKLSNTFGNKKMDTIEQSILQKTSFILPLSAYSQKQFEKIVPETKHPMIVCGYPIKASSHVSAKQQYKTILAVGRFSDPRKNIAMLMRVFGELSIMLPDVRLIIVGQIPAMVILAPFTRHAWFDNITFTGPINDQQLKAVYEQTSVMLITSYQEGFCIAGLEALAHGIPIISTDCGGVRDFVLEGQTGSIVAINNDKDMTTKTHQLLINNQLHTQYAQEARNLAETQFSQERIYSLFQHGLTVTYPELKNLFIQNYERTHHQPYLHSAD